MRNSIQLILILLTISTISCKKQEGYIITGKLTGFQDSTMVYLLNLNTDEIFDSTLLIAGKFQLRGQLQDEPEQVRFIIKGGNTHNYTSLLIGNEKVKIEGDVNDFPWNVNITGSNTQDDFNFLRDLTKSFEIKRDSIARNFFNLPPEEQQKRGKEIWTVQIKAIDDTIHSLRIGYVKSHFNTYNGIINLGQLKKLLPKDTVQALYNKLNDEIKASKYANVVKVFLDDKISEVGDNYHDFRALNKEGDTITFSSLIGKYLLLDFTSVYCAPCLESIEELRLIDNNYSDSLDIISFSIDTQKDVWLNSLEKDSISWLSLWDGKGKYSETYIKYGVQGYPSFLLFDPKGKIIDKWIGYEKGFLENKLSRFKN